MNKKEKIIETHKKITVTPSDLLQILDYVCSPYDKGENKLKKSASVMIWGPPGIGKSALVTDYAMLRGRRLVALHLPQFDPVDIKGIPVRMSDGSVKWVPTSYLPQMHSFLVTNNHSTHTITLPWKYAENLQILVYDTKNKLVCSKNDGDIPDFDSVDFAADIQWINNGNEWVVSLEMKTVIPKNTAFKVVVADKAVIFLDELSAAEPATQNAALQLVLDRRVNEYEIPFNVPVIGAGNGEGDGAYVQGMSLPLANRFSHFNLIASAPDWLKWAIHAGVSPVICGYIQFRGLNGLMNFDPDSIADGNYGFRTPRSWAALSDQFMSGDTDTGLRKLPLNCMKAVIAGYIGRSGEVDFMAYLETHDLLPNIDDILDGKVSSIADDVRKSHMWGLMTALGYKFRDRYAEHYNVKLAYNKQTKYWNDTCDNMIAFINNLDGDIASYVMYMLTEIFDIRISVFRNCSTGDFEKYASRYGTIFVNAVK